MLTFDVTNSIIFKTSFIEILQYEAFPPLLAVYHSHNHHLLIIYHLYIIMDSGIYDPFYDYNPFLSSFYCSPISNLAIGTAPRHLLWAFLQTASFEQLVLALQAHPVPLLPPTQDRPLKMLLSFIENDTQKTTSEEQGKYTLFLKRNRKLCVLTIFLGLHKNKLQNQNFYSKLSL